MAFSHSLAVCHASVLEDCIDQLSILGKVMPVSYQGKTNATELVGGDVKAILDSQRDIESKFDEVLSSRREGKVVHTQQKEVSARQIKDLSGSMALNNRYINQSLRQSPITSDNLTKVQHDRQFCEDVLVQTYIDILTKGDFQPLIESVRAEKEKKADLQQKIIKEEQSRRKIKQLQRQLQNINKEKEMELQQRNEMIAHLKDQLQEMKAKSNMEGKYVKKNAENQVYQCVQRCTLTEQELKEKLELLKVKLDEEVRSNHEIESYLKKHQQILENKVEHWMEKYDTDVEAKQHELNVLKTSKANDLARLQELTRTYAEYEQVVVEDRIEKEKERRKKEQEEMELLASIKVQSWWRTTMVRKQLGPFSKKKKGKGKKGKGKGGKKGKKKK